MSEKLYRCDSVTERWSAVPCGVCHACRNRKNAKEYMTRQRANVPDVVRAKKRTWRSKNVEECRQKEAAYRAANPHRLRKYNKKQRLKKFGLSPEGFEQCLREQDGRCALPGCRKLFGVDPKNRPHVDHNHQTGETRKLLCNACNNKIGFFECNRDRLDEFAQYVDGVL